MSIPKTTFYPYYKLLTFVSLSHASFDFSISSFLKSENKAVLAINRGLPAVASRTPAYERLLIGCGLEEYLFSSNIELIDALKRLQHHHERERYLKLSQGTILQKYNCLACTRFG